MEPGHEDREYLRLQVPLDGAARASMEPGHEDREYGVSLWESQTTDVPQWSPVMKTGNTPAPSPGWRTSACLNGARS